MPNSFRFETPENVLVQYEPAGLGTRFLAWFVDQIILWFGMIAAFIVLIVVGVSFEGVFDALDSEDADESGRAALYFAGLAALIWGLSSFVYFGACELLLGGQTIGKRVSGIRVVKSDGFQLDAGSILVRNLFRVADHLPPLWIVPVLSGRSQRTGDMVAGTIVVADAPTELSYIRATLAARPASEAVFRFDQAALGRLTAGDFEALERMLDRRLALSDEQRTELLDAYTRQLAKKIRTEQPPVDQQMQFLEDLFAAELRRQDRQLI